MPIAPPGQTHNYDDPFEEHVYFLILVWCRRCERVLEFSSEHKHMTPDWIYAYALQMKEGGWHVPSDDIWLAFCPQCRVFESGVRQRLRMPESLQLTLRCRD